MRVLIVDDSDVLREMLRCTLEMLGHEVVGDAATGEEAFAAYDKLRPDLVMLDLVLPGIDGLEVLRRLRAKDPRAQVILFTGNNTEGLAKQVREAGGVCVMEKPFSPDAFNQAAALLRRSGPT